MRLLSEGEIREILSPEIAVDAAAEAYRRLSSGEAHIPLRTEFLRENAQGVFFVMPGLIGESLFGLKLIANKVEGNTRITTAIVLVLDATTLQPRGLLSADYLTDYRSAAGFAAATRVLARSDAGTHAVYVAGKLSLPTILLVSHVRPVKRVILVSRTQPRIDRLKQTLLEMPAFLD